jgi:hypothetical protein
MRSASRRTSRGSPPPRPRLRDQLAVLLEQLARLLARVVGLAIDSRIRSRRSSIVFWIGPKAYRLSTKSVIAKQTIVQIIRPG